MNELVSIITPAYNSSKTIGETIESVISQTYLNWEMLIVDDCSTDNTVEIVRKYAETNKNIKLICLNKNSGSAIARNVAIKQANGRYIALLDSDDVWKPEKLKRQLSFMQRNNYAFTFTAYEVFRNSADEKRKIFEVPTQINYRQYMPNSIIGCLTVMVDLQQIPDFHMEEGYLEDVLTWMFYLRQGIIAYGLNENLASYRLVEGSKSSKKLKNAQRYYQCLKQQPQIDGFLCLCYLFGYMYNASKKRVFAKRVRK